jgi:filamentous hemagglutinin
VPVYYTPVLKPGDSSNIGALLVANDLSITGGDINNSGAIKANNVLSLSSASDLLNSGIITGGSSITITAANDIRNQNGGQINSGGNIALTATKGSFIQERDITQTTADHRGTTIQSTRVGREASVNASGNLTINTGQDIRIKNK